MSKNTLHLGRNDRNDAPQVRGDRGVTDEDDANRADQTGLLSADDEFAQMLDDGEWEQKGLPKAPLIPGWHLCWLTTNSTYDTIQARQRWGYVPVIASDFPGYEGTIGSAAFPGAISCNEMVLFKIPEVRYQAMMREFHHKRPLAEEQGIYERMANNAAQAGGDIRKQREEAEGFNELDARIKVASKQQPTFAS